MIAGRRCLSYQRINICLLVDSYSADLKKAALIRHRFIWISIRFRNDCSYPRVDKLANILTNMHNAADTALQQ